MKILQVISLGYPAGGAEASAVFLHDELTARGHEVRTLSADICPPGNKLFADYTFKAVPENPILKFFRHLFYFPSYHAMRQTIQEFQPDIIHFHTLTALSPSVLFSFKEILALMTVHGPEEFLNQLLPWFLPPPNYQHRSFELDDLTFLGKLHYFYYRFIQRPVYLKGLHRLKTIVAPSEYIANIVRDEISPKNIVQIYNGIPLPSSSPLPKNQRVLYVGRLEQVKGTDHLIRAFKNVLTRFPEAELYIVGGGEQQKELEALSRSLGLGDHVIFKGWIGTREKLIQEYRDASMLVIPSVWPENLPTVCIEALAVGRPVVGTRIGGIPELVMDNKTGYIVPVRDEQALGDAIIKVLSDKNPDVMSHAAAESARRFSIKRFVDEIEKLYLEMISLRG